MTKLHQCEGFCVRYTPDPVKNEFYNVGVLLRENNGTDGWNLLLRFDENLAYVSCRHPNVDVQHLQHMLKSLEDTIRNVVDISSMSDILPDEFCGFDVKEMGAIVTDDPQVEIERLAREHVLTAPKASGKRQQSRTSTLQKLEIEAFTRVGIWGLMQKKIAAAPYTHKGDPLTIDCAYQKDGPLKMFHAVPLSGDLDAVKALAFSFPLMQKGIYRSRSLDSTLTAIVEDNLDRTVESIGFGWSTLEDSGITIAAASQLSTIAELARRELQA